MRYLFIFILFLFSGKLFSQTYSDTTKTILIENGATKFRSITELIDSSAIVSEAEIIFTVDSTPQILTNTYQLNDLVRDKSTGATYQIQSDSVAGYTTDSVAVIPNGSNYAILQPINGQFDVKWFGAVGDGITDETSLIKKSLDFSGLLGGELHFSPGVYIATEIDFDVFQSLKVVGYGATIKRQDNYMSADFQRLLDGRLLSNDIDFSIEGLNLDANSRNNADPPGLNDWEHNSSVFLLVETGIQINSVSFDNMFLYDKAVYDHISVFCASNEEIKSLSFKNIGSKSTHSDANKRPDIIWYQGVNNVVVDNVTIQTLDIEYTGSPFRKQLFDIRNSRMEILELSGNSDSDTDSIFVTMDNVHVDSATSFTYVRVYAKNCILHKAIPVRLGSSTFEDCEIYVRADDDGWNLSAAPLVDVKQEYHRTKFKLQGDSAQVVGYHAVTFPTVLTSETRERKYIFQNCEFLDTFWYGTLLRADVEFRNCAWQSQSTGIRASGLAGEDIVAVLDGGDFSAVAGVPIAFTNWNQSTNILKLDGFIGGDDARTSISGSVIDSFILSNRVTIASSLPTSAPAGDRVRLNPIPTNGITEYISTQTANTAFWKITKQRYLSGTTAGRPTLTSNDIGYIYLDTDLDPSGQLIIWNGTGWSVGATGDFFYDADGTLSGVRSVDFNSNTLTFNNSEGFTVNDPTGGIGLSLASPAVNSTMSLNIQNDVNEWAVQVNGSETDNFQIEDVTNTLTPINIEPNSDNNSIYINAAGETLFGTNTDAGAYQVQSNGSIYATGSAGVLGAFVSTGATTTQLSLTNTTPQDWRIGLLFNEDFAIRDETSGTNPFVIENTAPANSFVIDAQGQIGLGEVSPEYDLEILNATGPQFGISPDDVNVMTMNVASDGALNVTTIDAASNEADINFLPDGDVGFFTSTPNRDIDIIRTEVGSETNMRIINLDNTNTLSDAKIEIAAGGVSGGDAFSLYSITSGSSFSVGIDNTDSDRFKIGPNADPSTGTPGLTIQTDGEVIIGTTDNGAYDFQVNGFTFTNDDIFMDFGLGTQGGIISMLNDDQDWWIQLDAAVNNDRFQIVDNTSTTIPFWIDKAAGDDELAINADGEIQISNATDQGAYNLQVTGDSYFNDEIHIGSVTDQGAYDLQVTDAMYIGGQLDSDGSIGLGAGGEVITGGTTDNGAYALQSNANTFLQGTVDIQTIATNDDPNMSITQARVATTDGTTTTLQTIPITANRTYILKSTIIARRTGGSAGTADDGASYVLESTYTTKSATVTLMGSITSDVKEDQAGWDATYTISGANILLEVTGALNNNVTWHTTTTVHYVGT